MYLSKFNKVLTKVYKIVLFGKSTKKMARMRQLKIAKQVTNRDTPSLDKYLQEIGKVKLITAAQEVELARRIKQGENDALEELAKANLRFVVSVAKQYQGQGLSLPDLISEGNLGLIKAAGRFDETRGFKFISYAVWWIRQQILQAIAEQSRVVRLPLNKIGSINKIGKAFARLEQEHERAPSAHELAEVLEMTLEEVETSLNNAGRHMSLDAPLSDSHQGESLADRLQGDGVIDAISNIERRELKEKISKSLRILTGREAEIIRLYFGLEGSEPHTLEEIGRKIDLTREGVRQIKEKAIRRMKHDRISRVLRTYLDL